MKIAHISSSADIKGGAELCLVELLQYEIDNRVEPCVILPKKGTLQVKLKEMGIPYFIVPNLRWRHRVSDGLIKSNLIYFLKRPLNVAFQIKLLLILQNQAVDLVHINTTATNSGLLPAKILNIPVIWHLREFNSISGPYDFYKRNKSVRELNKADFYIAVSTCIKKEYSVVLNSNKIITIYDSITLPPKKVPHKILSSEKVEITVMGNKMPAKGQLEALEAMTYLPTNILEKCHLNLIGGDSDKKYDAELHSYAARKHLTKYVTFEGVYIDPYIHLQHTDIALNCSRSESFGRTTIEAMASACLTIGKDNTCTHDLLSSDRGLLYKTPEDLANLIMLAVQDINTSQKIAESAQEFIYESFIDGSSQIVSLFKRMINQ